MARWTEAAAALYLLLTVTSQWQLCNAWGWLMIGVWNSSSSSAGGFTLPCEYQTCIQVPGENVSVQLSSYRCRGEVWWQEQFTYDNSSRQLTTQPRKGPFVCVDMMAGSLENVGVADCNTSSRSQRWLFVGTKIQNEANSLFMRVQPATGYYLTSFAGASLSLSVGASGEAGYISDFTLMDSTVLQRYKPSLPNNTANLVKNGLFGLNWREPLGLEAADMTEICNWKIMADIDLNVRGGDDRFGWNVQLNAGPQHVNRHGQLGAISQLVPTYPNRLHTLLFQGSGLKNCGGTTKNVTVSIVPSSMNVTTVSIPAGQGWQLQYLDFNTSSDFVNLTLSSASDEGSFCGPNVTDVRLGLKGAFDGLLPKKKSGVLSLLDAGLIGALAMMVGVQFGVFFLMRKQIRKLALRMPDGDVNVVPTKYSFQQMVDYTMDFQEKIGEGGYSVVYLGTLPNGLMVAVKRNKRPEFTFKQEVDVLSRVHHRRIARFIGYCNEMSEQMLVSEYMENGSLYDMLHGVHDEEEDEEGGQTIMTLEQRLRIVREVAVGLEYLHHGASPGIIHRDIKSANVLLDSRLSAKLADFGCFKQGHDNTFSINSSLETTNYRGTFGYMDPTCATNLTVSTKSDVYSFGVLILELVTGRKAMDVHAMIEESRRTTTTTQTTAPPPQPSSPSPSPSSSETATSTHIHQQQPRSTDNPAATSSLVRSPAALSIVDPHMPLESTADIATLQVLVSTAYLCLNPVREERPSMIEVVRLLGPAEAFEDGPSVNGMLVSVSPGGTAYQGSSSLDSSLVPLVGRSVNHSFFTQGR